MRHDLTTLRLVLAVSEAGSISRGADRMAMALAAASSRITSFEARLGFQLFVRHARGVRPTENGKVLCQRILALNNALDAIDNAARSFARSVTGHLRIAATSEAIVSGLPRKLSEFAARYPEATFSLAEESGDEAERLVMAGEADLAVYPRPQHGPKLTTQVFGHGRWHVLLPKGRFKSGPSALQIDDLLELPILSVDRSSEFGAALAREALRRGKELSHALSGTSGVACLVEAAFGVCVVSDAAAAQAAAMFEVEARPINDPRAAFDLVIGMPRREHAPTLTLKAFDELALEGAAVQPSARAA